MKLLRYTRIAAIVWLVQAPLGCGDDDDSTSTSQGGTAGVRNSGGATAGGGIARGGATSRGGGTSVGAAGEGGFATGGSAGSTGGFAGGTAGASGGATETGGEAGSGGEGGAAVRALSDAQVFLVLDTLNASEIDEANAALPRLTVTDVATFAQKMTVDHGQARADVLALAQTLGETPAPSFVEAQLRSEGQVVVATLNATSANAIDATYINSQVEAHAQALALLEGLQVAANASQLVQLIGTLKASVQDHYAMAVTIQASLQ